MEDIKEKTADEMFYITEDAECIYFSELHNKGIKEASVIVYKKDKYIKFNKTLLEIEELQAINKKCKELRMGKVVSKKYKKRLKLKPDFEEYLNAIYDCYVLEKDENLDKGARELKYSYMYVIDNMILHDCLEKIKC